MISTIDTTMQYVISLDRYFSSCDASAAILAILLDLGFSVQCDGFIYLRLAIGSKYDCPQLRCQDIYEAVLKGYISPTSPAQIEQAIRSAIDAAWATGPREQWELLFPSGKSERRKRPANFAFISRIACILELWNSCHRSNPDICLQN